MNFHFFSQPDPGHTDDLMLIFHFAAILDIPKTDGQYPLSKMMTQAIGDFVKAPEDLYV